MACNYYYNSNAIPPESEVVDKNWVAYYGGIDPDTSTPAELAAAGFYCYISATPPTVDTLIYEIQPSIQISGTDAIQQYNVVDLPLADSQSNYINAVKNEAFRILRPTDWLVIRLAENATSIPTDWNNWRESIRLESQTKHAAIDACTSASEIEAYVTSAAYTTWPTEPSTPL